MSQRVKRSGERPGDFSRSGRGVSAPELFARVRSISVRTRRQVTSVLAGSYRSTFRGAGIEFEEVRPYLPGDDVRQIDWKVTARKNDPHVKSFREDRQLTLELLVDNSASMDFGTRRVTKRELAAEFAALLAFAALENRDRVGLSLYAEARQLHLDPARSAAHINRIVREVIAAEPSLHGADLEHELVERQRQRSRGNLFFIVSDFRELAGAGTAAAQAREAIRPRLAALVDRHDVIAVHTSDPFEHELPAVGLIEGRDPETGERIPIDTASREVQRAWKAAAEARTARLRELFRRSRVDLIELSTAEPVADPVQRFFDNRMRGGRG